MILDQSHNTSDFIFSPKQITSQNKTPVNLKSREIEMFGNLEHKASDSDDGEMDDILS